MTDVLHARTDADLLAMVPRLAGYTARESLVCAPFTGTRSMRAFRLDLPRRQRDADHRGLADAVIAICRALGHIDAVALVVYTDRTFDAEHGIPCDDLAQAVLRRVHRAGLHITGAFCVAADGWGDYLGERPRGARPLSDIATSPLADPGIPAIDSLDALPVPDPGLAADLAEAFEGLDALPDPCSWLDEHPDAADAHDLAELVALAQWPDACPAILLHAAFGADLWEVDDEELTGLLAGATGRQPDPERIRAASAVVARAAANAASELRPPLLCLLAWFSWALGLSSVALRRLDEATAIDPAFPPAAALRDLTRALPAWVVSEPA